MKFSIIMPTNTIDKIIISHGDMKELNKHNWYVNSGGYAVRTVHLGPNPNQRGKYLSKLVYMHRVITNAPAGKVVDHINQNKLDNRRENLRICTQYVNMFNYDLPKHNTSGFRGVSWNKVRGKWFAQIKHNKKNYYLGLFEDINDAIEARRKAETRYV